MDENYDPAHPPAEIEPDTPQFMFDSDLIPQA
jgi:hypothetical protein